MADGATSGSNQGYNSGSGGVHLRRLSYASVASGAAQQHPIHPSRSGAFAHMAATANQPPYPPTYTPQSSQTPLTSELDLMQGVSRRASRAEPSDLGNKYSGLNRIAMGTFFVPSYLKQSRYAAKLQVAEAARLRATRDRSSSSAPLLPREPSSSNTHRLAPSHRGMTYDIIESNPPKDEDELMPLPSRWNEQDKYPNMELTNNGLDVKYTGSAGKAETEAASVRANFPMSPECGIYYYEVEIKQKTKDCAVAIGFSTQKASLERLPGWEADSWAYHGDDGRAFSGEHQGQSYSAPFGAGDIVGCGLNFHTGQAFFTRNGRDLGVAFKQLKNVRPFPSVGIKKYSGATVSVNFGQRPFVFDIDSKLSDERVTVETQIRRTRTANLHQGKEEHSLVQELVAQFLSHGGYVETAKAFASDRDKEQRALSVAPHAQPGENSASDPADAASRQQIRHAILTGNIDTAIDVTNTSFPNVLATAPTTNFRLKCRRWIELIGSAADMHSRQRTAESAPAKVFNGGSNVDDVFDQRMELDDEQQQSNGTGKARAEPVSRYPVYSALTYNDLLTEAMQYGTILQREYRDESKPEYKKTLHEISSLLAYDEPRESPNGHLLNADGRVKVAEELNGAILVSLGRSPTAALEKTFRQTEALIDVLAKDGGPAAFVNLRSDFAA